MISVKSLNKRMDTCNVLNQLQRNLNNFRPKISITSKTYCFYKTKLLSFSCCRLLISHFFYCAQLKASLLDNIENSSVCSWEAVEDRNSAQSSSAGNLNSSVLWVPDHCVSRCTGCQTEFWLGRRKHHCRYYKIRKFSNSFHSAMYND